VKTAFQTGRDDAGGSLFEPRSNSFERGNSQTKGW
jgi:hypothetical protein